MSLKDYLNENKTSFTKEYAALPADGDTWLDTRVVQAMVIEKPSIKDPSKMDLCAVFVIEGMGKMSDGSDAPARFRTTPMTLCAGNSDKPSNLSKFAQSIGFDGDCVAMVLEACEAETADESYLFTKTLRARFDTIEGSKGGKFTKLDKIKASETEYIPQGYDADYKPNNIERKVIINKGGRADGNVKARAWWTPNGVKTQEY